MSNLAPVLLQMGQGGMMPGNFGWGSGWLWMLLPSVVVGAAIVVIVFLFLHREKPNFPGGPAGYSPTTSAFSNGKQSLDPQIRQGSSVLGDVFRSLVPTLMDDEKRVVEELARAGSDVLQSDLPRMTSFSKATVSKAIHSLEVRGIVVREKHKWTYWCKINPRLVERVQRGDFPVPSNRNHPSVSP